MTDPAIEATNRACSYPIFPEAMNHTGSCLVTAAREMAKPIREWRESILADDQGYTSAYSRERRRILNQLAPLIYSTEELETMGWSADAETDAVI